MATIYSDVLGDGKHCQGNTNGVDSSHPVLDVTSLPRMKLWRASYIERLSLLTKQNFCLIKKLRSIQPGPAGPVAVDEKHERRRVVSLPVSSVFKNCNKLTLKQFLVNYTSASGSLKFGMMIIKYFLVAPNYIQSCFKYVSRFRMHNIIMQTTPLLHMSTTLLVKRNLRKSNLVRLFCSTEVVVWVVITCTTNSHVLDFILGHN